MSDKLDLSELMSITDIPGMDGEGTEIVQYEEPDIEKKESNPDNRSKDLAEDYETVRDNAHFQQQLLRLMALKAYENASQSDSPRQVEVFSTLMTQMTNNNKQILDIHKTMKEATQETVKTGGGNVDNPTINAGAGATVFVGSPTELMAQMGSQLDVKSQADRAREKEEKVVNADDSTTHE